jgi:hypothetical protein
MKQRHHPTNIQRIASQDEATVAEKFQQEMESEIQETILHGKLFLSDSELERELEYVSDGVDESGNEFQLYLGRVSRSPVIKNPRTGACFILPWADVIKLAEAAGLNR